jgi:hypothetical protein
MTRSLMEQKVMEAVRAQAEWLEEVLAGLLSAGVAQDDIEIRRFQSDPCRTVVAVKGEPKYENTVRFFLGK